MDTTMTQLTYQAFKSVLRESDPRLTCTKLKEAYEILFGTGNLIKQLTSEDYTVADTPPTPTKGWRCKSNQKEEGINPMFDNETWPAGVPCVKKARILAPMANAQVIGSVPVEATQRDYAIQRIKAIGEKHANALRVQFYMDSEETPKTARDLIAAIKEDAFRLDEKLLAKNEENLQYFGPFYGIDWGKNAPDTKGYEAAKEVLKTAAQKALDGATLKPVDQLEAAIDDFEGWKF